ncbi:hypothetical protein EV702DRAFT_1149040, partial [Suillus placidus]
MKQIGSGVAILIFLRLYTPSLLCCLVLRTYTLFERPRVITCYDFVFSRYRFVYDKNFAMAGTGAQHWQYLR